MKNYFSNRLKEAIELRGTTQKWLAVESQTTEATISRYISGKNEPAILEILRNIALALNVSSDYLIGVTNVPQSKDVMTEEERIILSVWSKVSDEDKRVFYALLDRYLSKTDKDKLSGGDK